MRESGVSVALSEEDMGGAVEWRIRRDRHLVIVHLGGRMDALETEMDGRCTNIGAANPGEFWLLPAGTRYCSQAFGGAIRYAEIEVAPELLPDARILAARSDAILAVLAREPGDDREGLGTILERLRHWTISAARPSVRPLSPGTARRMQDLVVRRLSGKLPVSEMASEAGLSVNALIEGFVGAFGVTPAQYVIAARLRRAQWLLLRTALDVTAIAFRTGFSSHAHLTSSFTRRFGLSPTAWRKKAWGDAFDGEAYTSVS